VMLLL